MRDGLPTVVRIRFPSIFSGLIIDGPHGDKFFRSVHTIRPFNVEEYRQPVKTAWTPPFLIRLRLAHGIVGLGSGAF